MAHWRVLAAVGSIMWGVYFIYDIPASLSIPLSQHLSLSDHQLAYLVSLLYTVYAAPNTVLPFFSGAAVQRFGERTLLLIIMSSIILGQLLFAVAVQTKFQLGMIAGRALIGLGGEVVGVLGCEIITRWFQDKRLSLALAINLGTGRLGSVANTILIPRLIEPYGIVSVTWIATVLSLGISTIGLVLLLTIPDPTPDRPLPINDTTNTNTNPRPSIIPSIRHFHPVYWHLALICLLGYGCLNTFTNSAQRFLATAFYNNNQRTAGEALSILFILSGILVPPFGFLLDWFSSRGYPRALFASNILLIIAHAIFLTRALPTPVFSLVILGAADALLNVSLWAGVARCLILARRAPSPPCLSTRTPLLNTIPQDHGRSYNFISSYSRPTAKPEEDDEEEESPEAIRTLGLGIMASLMNISTVLVPIPLAVIENAAGFEGVEGVFLVLGVLGALVSGALWVWWPGGDG
ncbi:major facilitator superfamily domain-containing protein [Aspergillus cavernicola]|uniref:Lysosomal dipeptide transporter MFSD1 n=1 Tax=Aspergillus cavernicola TaxID=176166 RepID=A0ABR4HKR6_9EURO